MHSEHVPMSYIYIYIYIYIFDKNKKLAKKFAKTFVILYFDGKNALFYNAI